MARLFGLSWLCVVLLITTTRESQSQKQAGANLLNRDSTSRGSSTTTGEMSDEMKQGLRKGSSDHSQGTAQEQEQEQQRQNKLEEERKKIYESIRLDEWSHNNVNIQELTVDNINIDYYDQPYGTGQLSVDAHVYNDRETWGVDGVGIVLSVPQHFAAMNTKRAKKEIMNHLLYDPETKTGGIGKEWSSRVVLEILYTMGHTTSLLTPSSVLSTEYDPQNQQQTSMYDPLQHHMKNQRLLQPQEPSSLSSSNSMKTKRSSIQKKKDGKIAEQLQSPSSHTALLMHQQREKDKAFQKSKASAAARQSSSSSNPKKGLKGKNDQISRTPNNNEDEKMNKKWLTATGWMNDDIDICNWEGIKCGDEFPHWQPESETEIKAPSDAITKIELPYFSLYGTIPTELATLSYLFHLNLRGNDLFGKIPTEYFTNKLTNLCYLDLRNNKLSGTIPVETATRLPQLRYLYLAKNKFTGQLPIPGPRDINKQIKPTYLDYATGWKRIEWLDLSSNNLFGPLPSDFAKFKGAQNHLLGLFLENNFFVGTLPHSWVHLKKIEALDLGENNLSGTIPERYGLWSTSLRELNLASNMLTGTIPLELLKLTKLNTLILGGNELTGSIPCYESNPEGTASNDKLKWKYLYLHNFMINDNYISGPLPVDLITGVRNTLRRIDISNNQLTGIIPTEIARLTNLERIDAMSNWFVGTLPKEMSKMNPNLELNFTNNLITGTVPDTFCGGGPHSMNFLYRQFGCDAVLCPSGKFHPAGAATLHSGCRLCPAFFPVQDSLIRDPKSHRIQKQTLNVIGRNYCSPNIKVINGDVDGDGIVSQREVLRLLFVETIGRFWGPQYQNWIDMNVKECDLIGVTCVDQRVAKLDLVHAAMCAGKKTDSGGSNSRNPGLVPDCRGLPAELGLLEKLEVLILSKRQFLMGTIPSEIGQLTALKYIDIGDCPQMVGSIPSEMGNLKNLQYLNLMDGGFNGSIPKELLEIPSLERIHLSNNILTGTVPKTLGSLINVREFFCSKNYINGTIPSSIGNLTKLENFEMYGNELSGTIPDSIAECANLKRLDVFNNRLTGNVPDSLATVKSLQILHLKMNSLTGTISDKFGGLPHLSWFDLSYNRFHGTIPTSFGKSVAIKDFLIGANMIYDPIPQALCSNENINGGLTTTYGCDGVICPIGTYSEAGHATHSGNNNIPPGGCKPCPDGETSMYLGSPTCMELQSSDILSIFFDAMQGSYWPEELREHWKNPKMNTCSWSGVMCDHQGEVISLGFPLMWQEFMAEGVYSKK